MMHNYADMLSLGQLSAPEFSHLLLSAADQRRNHGDFALSGKNLALIFEKPSLRTRVTFEVAIRQLGAWPILLGT
jgi:ornithine carbamoyltransferase